MRVLVIGGTNFIGPYVIRELHDQGHALTVYHRGLHEPDLPPEVRHVHHPGAGVPVSYFPAELTDPPPEIVLHMFPVGENDARAVLSHFAPVSERIVAISSGDVYQAYGRLLGTEPGPPDPLPLHEDAPLREVLFPYRSMAAGPADWTYHYEKILAERVLLEGPLLTTVLRLPAVYGPGDPHHRLRPYIKRMHDGRQVILLEPAQCTWRWSHGYVEDVAHVIATAVHDGRAAGRVYNVGETMVPTLAERVRVVGQMMGWRGRLVPVSRDMLPPHLRSPYEPRQDLIMSTLRIRRELGISDTVPEDEGLRRTIHWELGLGVLPGDPGPEEYAREEAVMGQGGTT
jgi:nucleoside-diphosphate-sugar epimerase